MHITNVFILQLLSLPLLLMCFTSADELSILSTVRLMLFFTTMSYCHIVYSFKGVPRNFHWGQDGGQKTESKGGVLGEGQQPPPHQLGVWGALWTPQPGSGRSPDRPWVFYCFSTQDGLSWHRGLACSHWGQDPRAFPPLGTPLYSLHLTCNWIVLWVLCFARRTAAILRLFNNTWYILRLLFWFYTLRFLANENFRYLPAEVGGLLT